MNHVHSRRYRSRTPRPKLPRTVSWAALALLAGLLYLGDGQAAHAAGCPMPAGNPPPADTVDPASARMQLLGLVQAAQKRSQAVGAAQLLADAAALDVDEVKAGGKPQLSVNATLGPTWTKQEDVPARKGLQLRPSLNFSWAMYDSGRLDHLTRWRTHLAEAAQQGQISQSEQVALQTINLALDRSRYRLHAQVWQQYAMKVCKLVESLDQIVAADKGRGSELVQARKTLQQVLLSAAQARTQLSITETRLRRLVGDELPDTPSLSALLPTTPDLLELQARATKSADMVAMDAQARAADSLAQATSAAQKLQAGWVVNVGGALGKDKSGAVSAGLSVSMPLLAPGADPAAQAARLRAQAARLQRDDALDALKARLSEVHQQAEASIVRARDVAGVLKHSERVREDTLAQWQQLGKRSLFDVMSAEGDHFGLRLAYVDALHDSQQSNALLWSLAGGVTVPLN